MADVSRIPQLNVFESSAILPLESRGIGTYERLLSIQGNSMLSTLRVDSIDIGASIAATYYDTTTGEAPAERNVLKAHTIATGAGTDRKVVTRFHDKPVCEVIVSGGSATFSVYLTVTADLALDPTEMLPPYAVVRGTPRFDEITTTTSPGGGETTILSSSVPVNTNRYLHTCYVSCRMEGRYRIKSGSSIIGEGRTGSGIVSPPPFRWIPARVVSASTTYTVTFEAMLGRPSTDVSAFLMSADETL